MGKFLFKVLGGSLVKVEKFLLGAGPGALIVLINVEIGLVPYLPVFDVKFISVCPALIIVTDDMLTNFSLFLIVLGRENMVLDHLMLDGLTETEKGLGSGLFTNKYRLVCAGEIVGGRVVYIGIKIRENSTYIVGVGSSVNHFYTRIVISRIGDTCGLIVFEITATLVVCVTLVPGTAVGGVEYFKLVTFFA